MKNPQSHQPFRDRLLARAGLLETPQTIQKFTPELIAFILQNKWSARFEKLMRTYFLMGALRYETPTIARRGGFKGRPWKIETNDIILRIRKFQQTGNTEFLVDVANLCMVCFETTDHPHKHFTGTDRQDTNWQGL